jgi:hypothetical protein
MAMSIDPLGTQAPLATVQPRQGRPHSTVMAAQRPDLAAHGGESRQTRARGELQTRPDPAPPPSIRVEYQQDRPILMLHDRSGVLIYQIPPKGALQLIRQEDALSRGLSERV